MALKVKKNDKVKILNGRDNGKTGKVPGNTRLSWRD